MALYSYKGFDKKTGKSVKGKIEADSSKAAKGKLRRENIIGAELTELKASGKKSSGGLGDEASLWQRLNAKNATIKDVAVMTRQFATLQNASVPLDECLKALTRQVEHPHLQRVLADLKNEISEGRSLAEATGKHPKVFDRLYTNMIAAGEQSGQLGLVLERLADYLENRIKTKEEVMGAITYPVIMMVASSGIIIYLFVAVVPKLTAVFQNMDVALPWYTSLMVSISYYAQNYWYLALLAAVAVSYLFQRWVNSEKGRKRYDEWLLSLPMFGGLFLRMNVSSFTRTLSTLLNSGVPIIRAMEITKRTISNSVIAGIVNNAIEAVQEGESLGAVFERSGRFPPLVSHMILTGEKTGQLEEMLSHVAIAYDAEVERKIAALIATISPLMIIVMGGIATVVVLAMLMPMFQVMNSL